MTDRDRLIELLSGKSIDTYADVEYVADYLIANGVIVPPCKVGQTIYYHFQFSNKSILPFTRKAKVKKIYCCNNKMRFIIDVELMDANERGIIKFFGFEDFGKTVFLTKEEAEKALKERADNGKID